MMEAEMLSEAQQKRVWEGMLGAEIRANYFADLSGRLQGRQRAAVWAGLVLSLSAVVSVAASLPAPYSWIRLVLTVATAGIIAYSVVLQNQKFAVDASDLHARWNRLSNDYERLWVDVYANDGEARLSMLEDHKAELSKAGSGFKYDQGRILKWETHVVAHRLPHAA
jgi:outer membrane murein-binding lipoprotein Lpp